MKRAFKLFSLAIIFSLLFSAVGLPLTPARAQATGAWVNVGSPGFSNGTESYTSLAFNNGVPFVAFRDGAYGGKATVMGYNGVGWVYLGAPGFSGWSVSYISFAFDGNTPYVVYRDSINGYKASLMQYDGADWVYMGQPGFSNGAVSYLSLAINGGIPYVAFQDETNGNKVSVMKFDGLLSKWVYVGSAGFSSGAAYFLSLVFDNGIPYVAFRDAANGNKVSVMKFDGINWVNFGPAGFSGSAMYISLAFDSGTPYVAYVNMDNDYKASVMKFNGTDWLSVGTPGFSAGEAYYLSFAFDGGIPYVAFQDVANGYKASVMKFNGTDWVNVGPADFSGGSASYTSIAFDAGTPYVAFVDDFEGGNASVMKFESGSSTPPAPTIDSPTSPINDARPTIRGTAYPGTWITVWYVQSGIGQRLCTKLIADAATGAWTCSWPVSALSLTEGSFSLYAKAYNGSYSADTVVAYVLDITAPSAPTVTTPPPSTNDTTPTISGTAEAGSQINVWYRDNSNSLVKICSNISVDGSGNWSCTSSVTLPERAIVLTVNATDKAGNTSSDTIYSFTIELTAPTCYALTLAHTGQGSNPTATPTNSTGCPAGQYLGGETINLSGAAPTTGWRIASWTGTNNDPSTASTNTLTMPASARTVNVNYTQIEYTLTITSAHGTVTKNPNQTTYHYGDIVQLAAAPATGWSFANWTGNATGTGNPVSVTINGNQAVTANYAQNCYSLTLSHTGQGSNPTASPTKSTACSTNGQYIYGASISMSGAVPTAGWQIGSWTGTANDSSTASTNSLTMPASSRTVSVNYVQNEYTLTVTSAHGTVTKNPNATTYHSGDVVQLTAASAAGWSFANWTGDATGTSNPVSVTMDGNKAVTANYAQNEYTLTITSAHGTVTKNPDKATYHYSDVVQLTTVPEAGWFFANWTGDATGATNPVSITMDGNKAVTANYTQHPTGYVLTIISAHGTVTKNPDKASYNPGETVQLNATADHDWLFVDWAGDVTGGTNPISVTMDGDKSIIANFVRSGAATTGVFRPSNGLLYLKNHNTTGFADVAINYGLGGDYPVVGDWDGDGDATIGIYRNGKFYLRNDNSLGYADWVFAFGQAGDQPIAGDWDGDGVDTIGVYYNGTFLLRNSNDAGAAEMTFQLGNPGDVGIAGDWNGDGLDTTGVFRPSNGVIFLKDKNESGFADVALNYGLSGDRPVTGDWDNNGIDTIGVYRQGQFMLRNENTNGFAEIIFGLGNPGDMPIAGDWDGPP